MKPTIYFAAIVFAGSGVVLPFSTALAGLPQPNCIYYGQARDGYGLPYLRGADVILRRGTNEVARHTISGSLSPGVNFALNVHLDDGRSTRSYSRRAVYSGELVTIVVRDSQGEKTIMEAEVLPPVGSPGELILRNVTAAEDADRDGLPDLWETELIAWSGGQLHSLTDVRGEDDFDGDAMSNLMEYRAGSFPFLQESCLAVEQMTITPGGGLWLTFLSVAGKSYSVRSATDPALGVWTPCPFGRTEAGPPGLAPVEGTGGWLSVYVLIGEPSQFLRLTAE